MFLQRLGVNVCCIRLWHGIRKQNGDPNNSHVLLRILANKKNRILAHINHELYIVISDHFFFFKFRSTLWGTSPKRFFRLSAVPCCGMPKDSASWVTDVSVALLVLKVFEVPFRHGMYLRRRASELGNDHISHPLENHRLKKCFGKEYVSSQQSNSVTVGGISYCSAWKCCCLLLNKWFVGKGKHVVQKIANKSRLQCIIRIH